ncbi:hypothetical protein J0X19_15310 [Hymenobacter sp. BT186]|uniref:Uncharacterized protein n=1 Tax=Hymenobacter telluris TaxID=2816474 RepID=A0A939EZC6_9BACT|nr:hypothetical protein [Hymenobacter telluris]MBO0359330.1 hypothetical protein [Hymenobacter telluris]MBW3375356.1 hypothetical protein [Hymenobacter norwichensis]
MRYAYAPLVLMSFVLLASGCEKEEARITNTNLFGKDWFDARQPDSVGFRKYNSPGQTMPWGNTGFRFEASGTFVLYSFAPTDGIIQTPSTWTTTDDVKFHIKPNNTQLPEYDIVIDALTPTKLKAQILP